MKILILISIILLLVLTMRIYGDDKYYENFESGDLSDEERININDVSQNEINDDNLTTDENKETTEDESTTTEPIPSESTIDVKINNYDVEDDGREKQMEMKLPMSFFKEDHGEFCKCDKCVDNNEYHVYLHHTINDITKPKKDSKKKKINNDELMSEENVNFFLKSIASAGQNKKNKKGKLSSYGTKVPKHIKKLLKPKFSTWHSPTGMIQHFGPLPANEYIL